MANEIRTQAPRFSVVLHSDAMKNLINQTLSDPTIRSRFIADISSVVATNPTLKECEPTTIITAGLTAASLNLPLAGNLGQAHLVPYRDNKTGTMKAQFQVGWKGYVQIAQRSGQLKTVGAKEVHKGELGGMNEFGEDIITFSHQFDDAEVIGYFAYFELVNGFKKTLFMTKEQCLKHATRYSASFRNDRNKTSLWSTDTDTMGLKTVMKQLLSKYAPLSVEMQKAILADQSVINTDGTYEYVDNEQVEQPKTKTTIKNKIVKEEPI